MTTVRTSRSGHLGRITLDRPAALNALNTEMVELITRALVKFRDDETIRNVLIDGAGERAFCAGGDVVMLHDSGKANGGRGDGRAEEFWRKEYALNDLIKTYSKPYVALIDGIVMGGGVGLSVHGQYRVAGDTTLFAMPETGIGYFPDVGGTYFLPRLGEAIGTWLALTGARLGPGGCLTTNVATHFVPTEQHAALIRALGEGEAAAVLAQFSEEPPKEEPIPDAVTAFASDSVAAILDALDAEGSDWSAKQAKSLRRKSPLALATTLRAVREGATLDFRDAMARELDLSLAFLTTQDFYEGIRAQLIDKDRNPGWSAEHGDDLAAQTQRMFAIRAEPPLTFIAS